MKFGKFFLTLGTEIKILASGTFIPWTNYRELSTGNTRNSKMDRLWLFIYFLRVLNIFHAIVEGFLKNLWKSFKHLFLNQKFKSFSDFFFFIFWAWIVFWQFLFAFFDRPFFLSFSFASFSNNKFIRLLFYHNFTIRSRFYFNLEYIIEEFICQIKCSYIVILIH